MPAKILIVDDEPPIIELLSYNLKQAHYDIVTATDGEHAIAQARHEQPDLIILDLMLPRIDGLEVFRILRRERDVPIIMLTARDAEVDRVVGLELGADDYIIKPFSVRELLARVRNVLRRATAPPGEPPPAVIRVGGLRIAADRYEAHWNAVPLTLTPLEFDVLLILARHVGQVLSRECLLDDVWGYTYHGDARAVDAVIKRLRTKLRKAAPGVDLIVTIRGIGYKLVKNQ
ncbi:MAG: response regulator transcription factor [Anaerolineae bacterium]|nr:response regulator transcription factor [Anaerolineae bacterium]